MATLNALYPPVVDTYMPAFLIDSGNTDKDTCKVYFSISSYNSISDIAFAQVTVRNQSTNLSVLNPSKYPSEVMLTRIYEDATVTTDAKYYVKILKTDVEDNNFIIDEYYKVQIRFTDTTAGEVSLDVPQKIDAWLMSNLDHFSEWSSVCLIRGISNPTLTITNWDPAETKQIDWSIANTELSGVLSFADENETEFLKSYRIKLYKTSDHSLLSDSGNLFPNNYNNKNTISYSFKYNFAVGLEYYFTIEYTTHNLYIETISYPFQVIPSTNNSYNLLLTGVVDKEDGGVKLQVRRSSSDTLFSGDIVIRRCSSKENFAFWEDMHTEILSNVHKIDFMWEDYTVESGVWYHYCVQAVLPDKTRGKITQTVSPLMIVLNDVYLTTATRQLKVTFNPNISSLKRNIMDTKIDTIGSPYPFIKRNGDMKYMTIPIGGLISSEMDNNELFTSKEELYGEHINWYDNYNNQYDIKEYSDVVYEKAFRDKVEEFLEADDIKLFRSPTEGNFLVRLMDVSMSPQTTLGRRLWSFTATAYEIDECTVDNFEKYKVLAGRYR